MKKIGIITCFLNNYGACLQALALQEQIKRLGFECKIIAYIGNPGYFRDDSLSIFKLKIKNITTSFVNFFKRKGFVGTGSRHLAFHRFRKKYLDFECVPNTHRIKFYESTKELNDISDSYDAFVCGSDQIWNPVFYKQNHPVHFLRFAGNKKRVAYAPSIGLSKLPEQYRETFIKYINDFDNISVREQAGSEIISELCGRAAKVVLDPTLLIGSEFWHSILRPEYKAKYKKYIFCYIFSNTKKCSDYVKFAQKKTGLPVIYMNISNLIYDEDRSLCARNKDPIEFLQLLKNAEFIITDSFHGTAFSLLFNKEFYVFERERTDESIDMSSRIKNILGIVGAEDRLISLENEFESKSIDYLAINQKLEILRKQSMDYLKNALSGE